MSAESSEGRPRPIPRFLSCLIKGPLGCLAFVLGAGVVIVVLLPAAGGRVVGRMLERWFAERHAGELELGEAWLGSFYGEQRVERLILRDPGGDEVLRGSLSAPSLAGIWSGPVHRFGPVRLRIEALRVLAGEDGSTNLERALEQRAGASEAQRGSGLSTDEPFVLDLELWIGRLRHSSENGREALLENLAFRGRLEWGPRATRIVLEGGTEAAGLPGAGGSPLHARVDLEHSELDPARPWDGALAAEGLPTVLARALCAAVRPLAAHAGPRLDALQWTRKGSEVALSLTDAGARLAFAGTELDGIVSGAEGSVLELDLPCSSAAGRELVQALLPPLLAPLGQEACEAPAAMHALRLHAFHWPLAGDWSELEGELELALAPGRATLLPLPGPTLPGPLVVLLGPQPARLPVREGVLDFAGLQLPLEDGWLRLDGTLELTSGARTLGVAGEQQGQPIERVELGEGTDFRGPRPPAPPELPAVPLGAAPLPPERAR